MSSHSLCFGVSLVSAILWTKLLCRIHHDRRRHVQTLHLSPEFLYLFLLHLPPPAEQVQMLPLPGLHVHVHQHAVWTGCADKVCREVARGRPFVGEASPCQGDVEGPVQARAVLTDAARVGDGSIAGAVGEVHVGAVSLFESLQQRQVAQTSCNQSPCSHQMTWIHRLRRPGRVLAGQRSRPARRHQAEEGDGAQSRKHFL